MTNTFWDFLKGKGWEPESEGKTMKVLLTLLSVLTTATSTTPLIMKNYDNFAENHGKLSETTDFNDSYDT